MTNVEEPRVSSRAYVCAYLLLKKEGKVPFILRKNTGFADGFYGLISGHVEQGESATNAMVREAYEEAGITIKPENLKVIHISHSQTNRTNISIVFECKAWEGDVKNNEPEKCERIDYFSLINLPANLTPFLGDIFASILRGEFFSEQGW